MALPAKNAKDEILVLREDVKDLQDVLTQLQRKRRDVLSREGQWKKLAYDQSAQRLEAIQENLKLRTVLAECRTIATGLLQLTKRVRPCTQALLTSEENEWKLNVLGSHPSRRHYNADKIMERLYRKLPSWSINSGLMDAVDDTHYSRCDHRSSADQPMSVEVAVCRRFNGHYVDIADAVWKYLRREDVVSGVAALVCVETTEMLADRIRLTTTRVRSSVGGQTFDHFIHELCQRVEEDARIVITWKTVEQRVDASPPKLGDNADGWISFEKAPSNDGYGESCLMKLSSTKQVLPIELMLQRSGQNELRLIKMMNRASGFETGNRRRQPAPDTIEGARHSFADFLVDVLWQRVQQVEQVAAQAASAPVAFISF